MLDQILLQEKQEQFKQEKVGVYLYKLNISSCSIDFTFMISIKQETLDSAKDGRKSAADTHL